MKIGIAAYAEAPSGLAVATVDSALALQAAGHAPVLFAQAGAELPGRAAALTGPVVRLAPPPAALSGRVGSTALFLAAKLSQSRRLARALADHPVDVVHVFSPGLAAALARPQKVVVQAWFHPPDLRSRLRTLMPLVNGRALYAPALMVHAQSHASDLAGYRRADLVLGNTPVAARALEARGMRSMSVPPMIEVPGELPAKVPSDALRVAFCGHPLALRRKGLHFLLDALTRVEHRPLRVTLYGAASDEHRAAAAELAELGIDMRLPGRVPRERLLRELGEEADLLAFPSVYEEWGYALFEALAAGVPALAFDLYPYSEIVDDRLGRLAAPRDPAALAAAIDRAGAGDLPEREVVRAATAERFGAATAAERLVAAYEAA